MNNISAIAAIGLKGELGRDNGLLAYIPNDLKRFRALTTGKTIVMGRKTYESLPNGALPNRRSIVISRDLGFRGKNVETFHSVEDVLTSVKDEETFIIGGGEIYKLFLPHVNKIYITHIAKEFPNADTYFPSVNPSEWEVDETEYMLFDTGVDFDYKYKTYLRL